MRIKGVIQEPYPADNLRKRQLDTVNRKRDLIGLWIRAAFRDWFVAFSGRRDRRRDRRAKKYEDRAFFALGTLSDVAIFACA
jgi:hypothetical protein